MIELVIVILGIFIAFQLTLIGSNKSEKLQYLELVTNVKLENEKNAEEFEELRNYRIKTVALTDSLLRLLNSPETAPKDSIRYFIFSLYRISTLDLQQQALRNLINSTLSVSEHNLKNEAIRLKALYDEWLLSSNEFIEFIEFKQNKFYRYLYDDIDFTKGEILNFKTIYSLRFKNNIWEIRGSEREQTRLYNEAFEQFETFHEMVLEELE